jgi:serine/threonine-protein kinase
MGVDPGTHLGVYQVVEQLGAGGMGEVYLARDTRLGREVALKVLRPSLATDPDRLNRFKHEARLLAALNHPHIAAIYDVEEHGGLPFLVLELVRGETLADRLTDRPLPRLEALRLAAQIASAIEAAHEQGIIHRDLKPGNIKITPAGDVKLLDFGIAKAFAGTTPSSIDEVPTLTSGGTREGTILGTAAYMSPEQARGKPVDRRTDVWSFGCVLFAMLTGRPAFAGDTLSDVIAAVLTQCPDWSLLPADTPPAISRLLHRCLEKELTRRLHDIGDARLELEDAIARPPESDLRQTVTALSIPRAGLWSRVGALPLLCSLLVGMLLGAGALWVFRARLAESPRPPIQFAVTLPGNLRLAALDFRALDIAPDDSAIAYVASAGGESRLFVRPLSATAAIALPGTDGALGPFFSPDGQWIAFFADGKLKKVPVAGGPVRVLADAPIGFGGAWADDNTVVYAPNNGSALWRVSADGGAPQAMTELDTARGEFSHRWPDVLPGGKAVVYAAGAEGTWDDAEIVAQTIGRSDRRTLVHGGTSPRYLEPGRLLYTRGGTVFAVALDASALQVSGEALAVLSGVHESLDGAAELAVSRTGSLVYAPGSSDETACTLVWVDRRGNVEPLAAPARAYADPRISPDGRRVAVTIRGERDNVWTYEIASNTLTQLTFDGGAAATWSSDGKRIVFSSSRGGPLNLFHKPADGSGADLRLTTDARRQVPESASPDGSMLAFVQWDDQSGRDIQLLGEADRTTRPFLASGANEGAPAFSQDARLIAYTSDASGTEEVYVAPVSDASRAVRVSTGGGTEPVWCREGAELSFRSANRVLAAAVRTAEPLRIETPSVLFEGTFQTGGTRAGYDISADGARFLMVRPADADRAGRELRVFINWRGDVARGTVARQAP